MNSISAPMVFLAVIVAAFIIFTRAGRILAGVIIMATLFFIAVKVFVHSTSCPQSGSDCVIDLQPVWSGFCVASTNAGILRINQIYVLAAPANTDARATCVDIRVWQ